MLHVFLLAYLQVNHYQLAADLLEVVPVWLSQRCGRCPSWKLAVWASVVQVSDPVITGPSSYQGCVKTALWDWGKIIHGVLPKSMEFPDGDGLGWGGRNLVQPNLLVFKWLAIATLTTEPGKTWWMVHWVIAAILIDFGEGFSSHCEMKDGEAQCQRLNPRPLPTWFFRSASWQSKPSCIATYTRETVNQYDWSGTSPCRQQYPVSLGWTNSLIWKSLTHWFKYPYLCKKESFKTVGGFPKLIYENDPTSPCFFIDKHPKRWWIYRVEINCDPLTAANELVLMVTSLPSKGHGCCVAVVNHQLTIIVDHQLTIGNHYYPEWELLEVSLPAKVGGKHLCW